MAKWKKKVYQNFGFWILDLMVVIWPFWLKDVKELHTISILWILILSCHPSIHFLPSYNSWNSNVGFCAINGKFVENVVWNSQIHSTGELHMKFTQCIHCKANNVHGCTCPICMNINSGNSQKFCAKLPHSMQIRQITSTSHRPVLITTGSWSGANLSLSDIAFICDPYGSNIYSRATAFWDDQICCH